MRSIWDVVAVCVRAAGPIARAATLGALAVLLVVLVLPRTFTTAVSFRPTADGALPGQLSSLATQFGVRVPQGADEEPPEFYSVLLRSQEVLGRVARRRFQLGAHADVMLDTLVVSGESDDSIRHELAIRWLRDDAVAVSTDQVTAVVGVRVKTRWPELSAGIAAALLAEVERYNRERRQSQSLAERQFAEGRLAVTLQELRYAEEQLTAFRVRNRITDGAPELVAEQERLVREVGIRQQVYASVASMLEQARLAEVRSTPVISVVQGPYIAILPDRRGAAIKLVASFVILFLGGIALVVFWAGVRPVNESEQNAFEVAKAAARQLLVRRGR